MNTIDLQEFGRLQAQVETLITAVGKLDGKVDDMGKQLAEAKGGWRVLMAIGGASATAGGALSWLLTHFTGKGPT
jgi:hypothetical protein